MQQAMYQPTQTITKTETVTKNNDDFHISSVNKDQLISNRNLNTSNQNMEVSSLRKTSNVLQEKNDEVVSAYRKHSEHLNLKKQKLKKYYEDYVNQLNLENENLQNELRRVNQEKIDYTNIYSRYQDVQNEYQSVSTMKPNSDLRNLQKQLGDLQNEKQRLVDMLEIEKQKLNEVHKHHKNQEVQIDNSEQLMLQQQITELKRRINEKRSRKIIQEKIIEKEAPKRTQVIIEEVPEIKKVTKYVETCECGCLCYQKLKQLNQSVRRYVDSNDPRLMKLKEMDPSNTYGMKKLTKEISTHTRRNEKQQNQVAQQIQNILFIQLRNFL